MLSLYQGGNPLDRIRETLKSIFDTEAHFCNAFFSLLTTKLTGFYEAE